MKKEFKALLDEKGRKSLPNVLLAAAECAPLSKTGGLADVVGTLPKSLKELGIDARIITPYHRCIKDKYADRVEHMFDFYVNLGWRTQYCGIERLELDGVCVYLVDNEFYFGDRIYKGGYEEGEQYAFFTRAVLDAIPNLGFTPDVVHCNDWHTAMLPMLAKTQYGDTYAKTRWLLTIHNIAFQGKFGFDYVQDLLGVERKYIEEVGAMNVMFKINGEIVTPKLTGSILPGITRKSCIEVLKSEGYTVNERLLSVDELGEALRNGTLEEAWGCGTAAVVSPIGELCYKDEKFIINNGEIGAVTQHLYDVLTGIQWGNLPDKFGWTVEIL